MNNCNESTCGAKAEINNGVTIVTDLRKETVSVYYPRTPPTEVAKWLEAHGFAYQGETRAWICAQDLTGAHLRAHECAERFPAERARVHPGEISGPGAS